MEVNLRSRHPILFKRFNVALHAVGAIHFWFGVYYDWFHVIVPAEVAPIYPAFGYKLKFLTYWDAILQAVYFTTCLANDVHGYIKPGTGEPTKLSKAKDFMMSSLAFPMSMFVGVIFWTLMAVDRELVLPKVLDAYFPSWLNHIMHTNIMIFQLLELVSSSRQYPRHIIGCSVLVSFETAYNIWMHIVYYMSGFWVYPVFNVLNIPQRILFIGGSYGMGFLFYFMGERLNKLLWEGERREIPMTHPNVKYSK